MPKPKPLSKEQILAAQAKTKSNMAAARYLHVSYTHYKMWAKRFEDLETGKNLFDKHKNQQGKGIPKFLKLTSKEPALIDIIEGRISSAHFTPEKLKSRLLTEGFIEEKCNRCKFEERRVLDYKVPLLMHFKDGNKNNYFKDNIEMLCYNCFFLTVGDVFTQKDVEQIETSKQIYNTTDKVDWEVDDYHLRRLKELGLSDEDEDDVNQYISRI